MRKSILTLAIYSISGTLFAADVNTNLITANNTGIALQNVDKKIRLQDDFYKYTNGLWLQTAVIPADKASWGAFNELRESSVANLHTIILQLTQESDIVKGTNKQKISDLYFSYMNEAKLDKLGIAPLNKNFELITKLDNKKQIAGLMAQLSKIGISGPFDFAIHQDAKNSTVMIADIMQTGLGLPDRDYYLNKDDKKLMSIRDKYLTHIQTMLELNFALTFPSVLY